MKPQFEESLTRPMLTPWQLEQRQWIMAAWLQDQREEEEEEEEEGLELAHVLRLEGGAAALRQIPKAAPGNLRR